MISDESSIDYDSHQAIYLVETELLWKQSQVKHKEVFGRHYSHTVFGW